MRTRPLGHWNVLLVSDSLALGGAERHVVGLARSLLERGHTVSIACSTGGPLATEAHDAGVIVETLGDRLIKRQSDPAYREWLRHLTLRLRPDLVHAHMHASAVAAAQALIDTRVPFIVTEHSEGTWRDAAAWAEAASTYRRAQGIVAVSARIAQRIAAAATNVPRIHVIRNALELAGLPQRTLQRRFRRRQLVGVIARLVPEKGVDVFVRAAAKVAAAVPQTCFVVVGDGPERRALQHLATDLGIRERIGFVGAREESMSVLQRLDLLCVPSRSEGTPLVVLEAMAAGTPIVAAAAGGIPEQVRDRREALLVTPDDPDALAAATVRLLEHRLLALALALAARRRVTRTFAHDRMVSSLEDVYRSSMEMTGRSAARTAVYPVAASA